MTDLIFVGKIDESEVEKLHEGMEITLAIGAISGANYPASLEHIAPKGIEESGAIQFEIKAAVHLTSDQFLRAGYSANAEVILDRRDSVLTISELLVQYSGHQPFVDILIAPNTYERRDISLGLSDGLIVEVLSGLSLSDDIKVWNQPSYDGPPRKGGRKGRGK
jgi:HlyD family secretion protein